MIEHVETLNMLYLYRPDRWSRINLGWDPATGSFLGWYVNFELPAQPTGDGLVSEDLVLDLWVNPDRTWRWKTATTTPAPWRTASSTRQSEPQSKRRAGESSGNPTRAVDHSRTRGPRSHPDPAWSTPRLPPTHAWNGDYWTLQQANEPLHTDALQADAAPRLPNRVTSLMSQISRVMAGRNE